MKLFRAQLLRPGYNEVEQGVNKSKDAIENCLCRDGFTFDGMKEVLNTKLEIMHIYIHELHICVYSHMYEYISFNVI